MGKEIIPSERKCKVPGNPSGATFHQQQIKNSNSKSEIIDEWKIVRKKFVSVQINDFN